MESNDWRPVPDFPGYFCNRKGEFLSTLHKYGKPKIMSVYRGGSVPTILLSRDGKQWRRSVVPLVERAFEGEASTIGEWVISYKDGSLGKRTRDQNGRFIKHDREEDSNDRDQGSEESDPDAD